MSLNSFAIFSIFTIIASLLLLFISCGVYRENCGDKMDYFLQRCFYHSGQYGSEENFVDLDKKLKEKEVRYLLSL